MPRPEKKKAVSPAAAILEIAGILREAIKRYLALPAPIRTN